jgi:hypothetical protein
MNIKRATAVLFVDRVEDTKAFLERAGFTATIEVREENGLGFSLMESGAAQVMVQTRDNAREPSALRNATRESRHAMVFIEVEDIDAIISALEADPTLVERHSTFYGADEVTYREPGGHLVTFAQFNR